jgi:hypothetical protein
LDPLALKKKEYQPTFDDRDLLKPIGSPSLLNYSNNYKEEDDPEIILKNDYKSTFDTAKKLELFEEKEKKKWRFVRRRI